MMDSIDKKITFILDKVRYPSEKFENAFDVLDIQKEDMLKYLLNPENKYGFESENDLEKFILENLSIIMGGDAFVIHLSGGFDEYIIIKIKDVEIEAEDDYIRIIFDVPEVKLKITSDGKFYYNIGEFFDDYDKIDDLHAAGEWFDEIVQDHIDNYGNKFGLSFSI